MDKLARMLRLARIWVLFAWSLWFGGLLTLFILVTHLFATDRDAALHSAPLLFQVFERYQIILACAAMLGVAAWRILAPSSAVSALFWLLAIAAAMAALGPMLISNRMHQLWLAGQSASDEFKRLHARSMMLYLVQTLILAAAGLLLSFSTGAAATLPEIDVQPATSKKF